MTPTADDQFIIPKDSEVRVDFLLSVYSTVAEELADKLFACGLSEVMANTGAVLCLSQQACELAVYTAIAIGERRMTRDQWLDQMGDVFDRATAARAAADAERRQ